jgi:hypothetical protein
MNIRRRRWPRLQFSLRTLLMLMVVVGLVLAWHLERRKSGQQTVVIESQEREIMRLTVNGILRRQTTDAEKADALRPLVKLGESIETIEKWGGPRIPAELAVPGRETFRFADCDLVVECDAAGVMHSFGYQHFRNSRCDILLVYVPVASDAPPSGDKPQSTLSRRPDSSGGMR